MGEVRVQAVVGQFDCDVSGRRASAAYWGSSGKDEVVRAVVYIYQYTYV
jgi:hypothetical protein